MIRKICIFLSGLLLRITKYSQKEPSFLLQTGAGYYEGFHAGLQNAMPLSPKCIRTTENYQISYFWPTFAANNYWYIF